MGLCVSCDAAADGAAADGAATARVVLPTSELREYSKPATAALALEEVGNGKQGWFLCDADAMGIDGSVAAVAGADELRPGQIYFVLPAEMLRRSLTLEEVAALAVKASAALVCRRPAPAWLGGATRVCAIRGGLLGRFDDFHRGEAGGGPEAGGRLPRPEVAAEVLSRLDRHPGERVEAPRQHHDAAQKI
jgi:hypothetical protein